jgi:putative SOS response-associated peptidase YedK
MCYAYKPVKSASGRYYAHTATDINRMLREGSIRETVDGFVYAKDTVAVITGEAAVRPMRWDLIPRGFMRQERLDLKEAVRAKDSRRKDSKGFSSYNARIETVETLWAFRDAWREGKRALMPVAAWRERPNMDEAPREFKGREYEVALAEPRYLAAIYDTWQGRDGKLESCTVLTGPSDAIPPLRDIWHERTPLTLSEAEAQVWLDPATTPEQAMALLKAIPPPPLTVTEIVPEVRQEELHF